MFKGPVKLWPWATIAKVAGAVLAAVIVVLIYRQLFVVPGELRQDAADAKQDTKAAEGGANMANTTLEVIQNRTVQRDVLANQVRENERNILSAPGANEAIPADVHNAGIDAIRRMRQPADQRQR